MSDETYTYSIPLTTDPRSLFVGVEEDKNGKKPHLVMSWEPPASNWAEAFMNRVRKDHPELYEEWLKDQITDISQIQFVSQESGKVIAAINSSSGMMEQQQEILKELKEQRKQKNRKHKKKK
jgi:histidinol phosphatase-like enzyme